MVLACAGVLENGRSLGFPAGGVDHHQKAAGANLFGEVLGMLLSRSKRGKEANQAANDRPGQKEQWSGNEETGHPTESKADRRIANPGVVAFLSRRGEIDRSALRADGRY